MVVCFIIFILYSLIILSVVYTINAIKNEPTIEQVDIKISVVVACKNEEFRILEKCIRSIVNQHYLKENFELIVVEDNSSDNTFYLLNELSNKYNFNVIKNNGKGKKSALSLGIQLSKNETILVTDADCILQENHLQNMANYYLKNNLDMLCGAVFFSTENRFEAFQKNESAALVGISCATLKMGFPTTCNAANLMFNKNKFIEFGAYESHINNISGDDDLLMQNWVKKGANIGYIINKNCQVETLPANTFNEFLNQRIRWISKSSSYLFPYNKIFQTIVFSHLIVFWYLIASLFIDFKMSIIFLLFLKYFTDFVYGYSLKKYFKISYFYVMLMPIFQLYIFIVLIFSMFKKTNWR